jgi:hypothetical protein
MKNPILSTIFLSFILGSFYTSAFGQTDNSINSDELNLTPVLKRLDHVVEGLTKVSEDLAKIQKTSKSNAKDQSIKSIFKQLEKLNESTKTLAVQLSKQTQSTREQAAASATTTELLKKLITQQTIAIEKNNKPKNPIKWEYKSIFGDSRVAIEEEMNTFGKTGWEFFNITSFGRGSAAFARRLIK